MAEELPIQPNSLRDLGSFVRSLTGGGRPMGSWTGLPPMLGAPVSGALIGAVGGGLYGAAKNWWNDEEEVRPWWRRPAAVGAAAGAGIGLVSGSWQEKDRQAQLTKQQSLLKAASMEASYLIRTIERDPSIAYYEKNRLINLVNQAGPSQIKRMAALAGAGALTAAAAHTILGTGFFGSAIIGGLAGMAFNNMFPSSPKYV